MGASNAFNELGRAVDTTSAVVIPTTNEVVQLEGMDLPIVYCKSTAAPSTINVLLPDLNLGKVIRVVVGTNVTATVKNAAATAICTVASGQTALLTANATAGTYTFMVYSTTGSQLAAAIAGSTYGANYSQLSGLNMEGVAAFDHGLPGAIYNTTAAASPVTPTAGLLSGARNVFYEVTTDGAFSLVTRTASQLYSDITAVLNAAAPLTFSYLLTIVNRGNNTITITPGAGITAGSTEVTLATLVTRTYVMAFTSATALTMTSVSKGTIET